MEPQRAAALNPRRNGSGQKNHHVTVEAAKQANKRASSEGSLEETVQQHDGVFK